ncbi:fungal-specific transcription factor domain-containing protein [Lipomyces oligophaga]|uniref:fungal-specific transcription factor domain-containing protein n=1 Tax=Lipomyces oligophaga TaxID=45792 RepID=UPI0034D00DF9
MAFETLAQKRRSHPQMTPRPRQIKSCVACHRRKVKCDRGTPSCSNCAKLELSCEYYTNQQVQYEFKKPSTSSERISLYSNDYLAVDPTTGESRYANGAFWGTYFKELADIPSILNTRQKWQNADAIAQSDVATAMVISYLSSSSTLAASQFLASLLPDKAVSDALINHYFVAFHPCVSILNRYRFNQQYEQFWNNHDLSFYPLLFAVYFASTFSISESSSFDIYRSGESMDSLTAAEIYRRQRVRKEHNRDQLALLNQYKFGVDIALAACKFPSKPSLDALQASVIIHMTSLVKSLDHGTSSIASLIRVAQLMGLHRDPLGFNNLSIDVVQCRRALWWQLIQMDYLISMAQGLPPIVHELEHDVKLPSEHIIENGLECEAWDASMIFLNAASKGAQVNCKILQAVYGVQKCDVQKISALDLEIENLSILVEQKCALLDSIKYSDNTPQFTIQKELGKYFMKFISTKAFAYLHHPTHINEPLDAETSTKLISSAIITVNLYVSLSRIPDHLPFVWFFRPVQPFHALLILLQDLYLHPPAVLLEQDSRLLAVENAFTNMHFLKIHEINQTLRDMWHVLNQLRSGTWIKIGFLNPSGLPVITSQNLPAEYADLKLESSPERVDDEQNLVGDTQLGLLISEAYRIANVNRTSQTVSAADIDDLSTPWNQISVSDIASTASSTATESNAVTDESPSIVLPNTNLFNDDELLQVASQLSDLDSWDGKWDSIFKSSADPLSQDQFEYSSI